MKRVSIVSGIILILLVLAWFFRWEVVEVKKDGILSRYKTDRWTGQKWVQEYGGKGSGFEEPVRCGKIGVLVGGNKIFPIVLVKFTIFCLTMKDSQIWWRILQLLHRF